MNRREAIAALLALGAAPYAHAQQARRIYRVAYPTGATLAGLKVWIAAFEQGLREHGYTPGTDVLFDVRTVDGKMDRYPELVREMVRTKPDVILAGVNFNINAVKAATQTIPIVMAIGQDVVRSGYAVSLARPGGNITGMTEDAGGAIVAKRLEVQHELAPKISRVAVLWEPPTRTVYESALETAASSLGLTLSWHEYRGDLEGHFAEMMRSRADAVFYLGGPRVYNQRAALAALDVKHRLPASYSAAEHVDAGGLMSYGANIPDLYRSAASHVARILKGAKPGDLPIEEPRRIDLLINLKTAKALGITVPGSMLFRADRIVE